MAAKIRGCLRIRQAADENQVPGVGLDGRDACRALTLSGVKQGGLGGVQLHGHQLEVAVVDRYPASDSVEAVNLDFDASLVQPHMQVLAGAVGHCEEKAIRLPGAHKHRHNHAVAGAVVQ